MDNSGNVPDGNVFSRNVFNAEIISLINSGCSVGIFSISKYNLTGMDGGRISYLEYTFDDVEFFRY